MSWWRDEFRAMGLGSYVEEMTAPPAARTEAEVTLEAEVALETGERLLAEWADAGLIGSVHQLADLRWAHAAAVRKAADRDIARRERREDARGWREHVAMSGIVQEMVR